MKHYFPPYLPKGSKAAKYNQINLACTFVSSRVKIVYISCLTFDKWSGA